MGKTTEPALRHTIFQTRWGYFGLQGTVQGIIRTCLPLETADAVLTRLISPQTSQRDNAYMKALQGQVIDYFKGKATRFSPNLTFIFTDLTPFQQDILHACRGVSYGEKVSYVEVAGRAGHARAARAAGTALSKNPIPLIIPCHRIITSSGEIGRFSSPGGTDTKRKLLVLEAANIQKKQ